MDVNYCATLIGVADDCPVTASVAPILRGGKKTLPFIQYEMLKDCPFKYTSAEVLFESNMRHKGISEAELKSRYQELWEIFFSKPQPCLRTCALAKKYGWGILCNKEGKVALCPMESEEYRQAKKNGKVVKALRSSKN